MEIDAPTSINAPLWTNNSSGAIVTSGQGVIDARASSTEIRNWGQIVGSTQIHTASFDWRAGTVGDISPATSAVLVFGRHARTGRKRDGKS